MTLNVENLFPTPIGITNLEEPLTEFELQWIKTLDKQKNMHNTNSVNSYLFQEKCMERLALFCEKSINDFFQLIYCPENPNLKLRITQSWSNYTKKNESHHTHNHSNSVLSGVFYVNTNAQDKIIFYKPHEHYKISSNLFNHWNSLSWWMPTINNSLLMFPSSLQHGVDVKETNDTRISIAFNTFFVGELGNAQELTQLIL